MDIPDVWAYDKTCQIKPKQPKNLKTNRNLSEILVPFYVLTKKDPKCIECCLYMFIYM